MQRGECAEHHRSAAECHRVPESTKNGINASETSGGSAHGVVSGRESLAQLVPRRRARKSNLNNHTDEIHESKRIGKHFDTPFRRKNEQECSNNEGRHEMHDTIRNPGKNVEHRMAESRENITDVRAVPDRLKSRKHGHPDMRASGHLNKTAGVK